MDKTADKTAGRSRIQGKFVWFELEAPADQLAVAQAFYSEVLGWKTMPIAMGEQSYEMIAAAGTPIGGYAPLRGARSPARWVTSVSVHDVDKVASSAAALGGKLLEPAHDLPNVGRRARIADPQGADLYVYYAHAGDPPDVDAALGSFFWNELHATHAADAVRFYEKLLGYTVETLGMGPAGSYHVLNSGGAGRGGVTEHLPAGLAPHWLPYVRVDDPDATLARAATFGGRVQLAAQDIPNTGRFGVLQDPTGAALAVMKPLPRTA